MEGTAAVATQSFLLEEYQYVPGQQAVELLKNQLGAFFPSDAVVCNLKGFGSRIPDQEYVPLVLKQLNDMACNVLVWDGCNVDPSCFSNVVLAFLAQETADTKPRRALAFIKASTKSWPISMAEVNDRFAVVLVADSALRGSAKELRQLEFAGEESVDAEGRLQLSDEVGTFNLGWISMRSTGSHGVVAVGGDAITALEMEACSRLHQNKQMGSVPSWTVLNVFRGDGKDVKGGGCGAIEGPHNDILRVTKDPSAWWAKLVHGNGEDAQDSNTPLGESTRWIMEQWGSASESEEDVENAPEDSAGEEDKDITPQAEPWKVDLAYSLGSQLGKPDDGAIQRLDASQYASITRAVYALNRGTLTCADGVCICYSNSHGMYFLLARTDKEEDGVRIARETFNVEIKQSSAPEDVLLDSTHCTHAEAEHLAELSVIPAPVLEQPEEAVPFAEQIEDIPQVVAADVAMEDEDHHFGESDDSALMDDLTQVLPQQLVLLAEQTQEARPQVEKIEEVPQEQLCEDALEESLEIGEQVEQPLSAAAQAEEAVLAEQHLEDSSELAELVEEPLPAAAQAEEALLERQALEDSTHHVEGPKLVADQLEVVVAIEAEARSMVAKAKGVVAKDGCTKLRATVAKEGSRSCATPARGKPPLTVKEAGSNKAPQAATPKKKAAPAAGNSCRIVSSPLKVLSTAELEEKAIEDERKRAQQLRAKNARHMTRVNTASKITPAPARPAPSSEVADGGQKTRTMTRIMTPVTTLAPASAVTSAEASAACAFFELSPPEKKQKPTTRKPISSSVKAAMATVTAAPAGSASTGGARPMRRSASAQKAVSAPSARATSPAARPVAATAGPQRQAAVTAAPAASASTGCARPMRRSASVQKSVSATSARATSPATRPIAATAGPQRLAGAVTPRAPEHPSGAITPRVQERPSGAAAVTPRVRRNTSPAGGAPAKDSSSGLATKLSPRNATPKKGVGGAAPTGSKSQPTKTQALVQKTPRPRQEPVRGVAKAGAVRRRSPTPGGGQATAVHTLVLRMETKWLKARM